MTHSFDGTKARRLAIRPVRAFQQIREAVSASRDFSRSARADGDDAVLQAAIPF
ncbi:hypothetical protein GOZ78_00240 [Agrobacterium vitis]|uniref:Uncharacterized protein n=1 Tax=Agrobacterium vitis TaxID=373 RepID=A0ABD6G9T0_AGRVI|nr:hypothetical protein [Agrobacterium vitis]MUO82185.1 hypothetical protein [Agrobacterium vitis]MUO97471.1 hypothetical protein [Agrobacterium vitis]MUP05631.1 hypothetical protein [Agrobacterium vitis]MUZ85304.1 hypothetical protein [Agrobacterium vitis]MVA08448.1 hypothetical protein [Agrobacterium vitis]